MKISTLLIAVAVGQVTPEVFALGLRIPDQDAHVIARGNAFVATADNPSAIYYNPAGISQLEGHNVSLSTYSILMRADYESAAGAKYHSKPKVHMAPQIYYAYGSTNLPVAFGLGLYTPYGLGSEWKNEVPFRTMTTRGELIYTTLNPVLAWKICDELSLAAGPSLNYGDTDIRKGVPLPPALGINNQFKFSGDGMAAGYNVGLLWKPLSQHSFGITYRSATAINFEGHSTLTAPIVLPPPLPQARETASASIDFPQQIVAGWSYHPNSNWNFEFNVDWTDWDVLDTVTLHRAVGSDAMPFNYQSSFMFEWGATRYLKNGWSVSGGYLYSQNSVPEQFFSPGVPDSDRHVMSVGIGKQYRWLRMDAAYQFGYSPEWSVNNASLADGKYTFTSHALALSLGVAF